MEWAMIEVKNEVPKVAILYIPAGKGWSDFEEMCLHSEALAAIAVRDARIAELEEQRDRFMASIERKHKLMNEDAAEIDLLRAELAALREQVPEGYKLLPVDPTPEMIMAGINTDLSETTEEADDYRNVYAAMIAAAPAPGDSQ
jgi:hypothetical protein